MIKFPFESKPWMIAAAVVLIGAPTAGATMKTGAARASTPSAESAAGRVMQIELVIPPEPRVAAVYPLETFAEAPADEFKGRVPHGGAWRVDFGFGFPSAAMQAEPAGYYGPVMDDEARLEQARFEQARDDYVRAERARAALLQAEEMRAKREVQAYEARVFGRGPVEPELDAVELEPTG